MSAPPLQRYALAWLIGGLSAATLAAGVGLFIIFSGAFDATATTPHLAPVAWATHATMVHSVRARAKKVAAPRSFSAAQAQAGLVEYGRRCAACHGGPGLDRAPWASGMTPTPPYLLDAARRWSPAELYWIIHGGVKMTAMPAWAGVERDDQIWELVAFLEALPGLSAADFARQRAAAATDENEAGGRNPPASGDAPTGKPKYRDTIFERRQTSPGSR